MAMSLRAKLSKLRHDGVITDEEYKKLSHRLGSHDKGIAEEARLVTIAEFSNRMILMMPGHRDDIQKVADQLRNQ